MNKFRNLVRILPTFVALVALASAAALVLQFGSNHEAVSAGSLPAESSSRVLRSTFWSPALAREMPYEVYLPQGYDSGTTARYPVLYMSPVNCHVPLSPAGVNVCV